MKNARWEKMVEREFRKWLNDPQGPGWLSIPNKLLARQHAAFVRAVKKLQNDYDGDFQAYRTACDDLLAALATQGRNKNH